jgi:hypothetical protein
VKTGLLYLDSGFRRNDDSVFYPLTSISKVERGGSKEIAASPDYWITL